MDQTPGVSPELRMFLFGIAVGWVFGFLGGWLVF
jgi:hypothetical protein